MRILVTGASGYIGSRLVPVLLERGVRPRCLTRDPARLVAAPWHDRVEVVRGDVADEESLAAALDGVQRAYYLVHALDTGPGFAERERAAAASFARLAARHGLRRVVYLGGLGDEESGLSEHLSSRAEVGAILSAGSVPVTVLRAAMVLGAGSASFEMMRYLTERVPVVVGPRQLNTRTQPVAVSDVLHYLVAAMLSPDAHVGRFDIGGPDLVSYTELMRRYAKAAGLRSRRVFALPGPRLSPLLKLWGHGASMLTPMSPHLVRSLTGSLGNDVVCTDGGAAARVLGLPPGGPTGVDEALSLALGNDATRQRPPGATPSPWSVQPTDPQWAGGPRHTLTRTIALTDAGKGVPGRITGFATDREALGADATQALGMLGALFGGARGVPHAEGGTPLTESARRWHVEDFRPGGVLGLRLTGSRRGSIRLEFECSGARPGRLVQRLVFRPVGVGAEMWWRFAAAASASVCDTLVRAVAEPRSR